MVGVHVRELRVDEEADLVLALLLLLPNVGGDDALGLLAEPGVPVHLQKDESVGFARQRTKKTSFE